MRRIVITDSTYPDLQAERDVARRHGASLELAHCRSAEEVVQAARGAQVLLVQYAQVTAAAINQLPAGAAIVRCGLGLDNIDLHAAHRRGVSVAYVPDYATSEVADHTLALMLALLRRLPALNRELIAGRWDPAAAAAQIQSLSDVTVGIIGFGRIGQQVQARVRAFDCRSLVHDPNIDAAALSASNARAVGVDELFDSADVVTLHVPLTPQTRAIVNERRLATMKPTSLVVNTARGALIDGAALEAALRERRLGGAALDVFEREPLPLDSVLRHFDNVILTPHCAWCSNRSLARVQALAADEVDRHLSGHPPRCPAPLPDIDSFQHER